MMKKLVLLILSWYLFVNSSEKAQWYVPVYNKGNVTIRVARDKYLEHKRLLDINTYEIEPLCERCGCMLHNYRDRFCHKCLMLNAKEYWQWEYKDKYQRRNQKTK